MNIQEFKRDVMRKKRQLDDLMHRRMPVLAGNIAKRHIEDDFRKGGFTHNGFHKWKETRRQKGGGSTAGSGYGPLLSGRNHLSGSTRFVPGDGQVIVSNTAAYAGLHNWGGVTHPTVTPKMRRFAWAMYYKATGIKRKMKRGGKARKQRTAEASEEALGWKRLALTRKAKLTVTIPQRQFMPRTPGAELCKKVDDKLEQEVRKVLNS